MFDDFITQIQSDELAAILGLEDIDIPLDPCCVAGVMERQTLQV